CRRCTTAAPTRGKTRGSLAGGSAGRPAVTAPGVDRRLLGPPTDLEVGGFYQPAITVMSLHLAPPSVVRQSDSAPETAVLTIQATLSVANSTGCVPSTSSSKGLRLASFVIVS